MIEELLNECFGLVQTENTVAGRPACVDKAGVCYRQFAKGLRSVVRMIMTFTFSTLCIRQVTVRCGCTWPRCYSLNSL